ncbi:MAG: heavy metal translocating P-type ATPase [Clostridia bacterium]|nr:heavy metal translocating P-type ATPase [Clostridia bacterium]
MKQFNVTGMSCAACSARVEKAVSKLDGVTLCSVNLLTNSMTVEGTAEEKTIISAVIDAGYGASVKGSTPKTKTIKDDSEEKNLKSRLISSLFFLAALMYISMGHVMWDWPLPRFFSENPMNIGLAELILSIIVMVINQKFFKSGFKGLINKAPNMDTLVALGSGASLIYSIYALFSMSDALIKGDINHANHFLHEFYFESAAMILTLITVGKMLEARSKGKTTDAIESLIRLTPKTATVIRDGKEAVIEASNMVVGDIFAVKPGESIPADGVIIEGASAVNESALTGESVPVDKKEGDKVTAATINQEGFILCRATKVGEDTALGEIIKLVSEASGSKAPIAKVADKVSGIFVPIVMVIAAVTVFSWLILGESIGFSLARGISVLVISCPCALGLATPVAIMVGSGRGAKNGILYKSAAALEEAGRCAVVALDKTGTVTTGEMKVTDITPAEGVTEDELLKLSYALEAKSEHPLAKAVVNFAKEKGIPLFTAEDFSALSGNGLTGTVEGNKVYGGKEEFIAGKTVISEDIKRKTGLLRAEGKTVMFFAAEDKLLGLIAVSDIIKEDSKEAVARLKKMGLSVVMLTGDNEVTAKAVAREAGIDNVRANLLPEDKEKAIAELSKSGKVMMVGDGINDAVALTRANVGVAIGAGTDVAIDSADAVIMKSSLKDVCRLIALSRGTLKNIHENLFWAFFYNTIGIPVAAGVFSRLGLTLNPMLGALAMSLSSFCVVSNALRLNFYDIDKIYYKRNNKKEDKTMEKTMKIEGMMCTHCSGRVKKVLEELPGVAEAIVSHEEGTAVVKLSSAVADETLKKAVEDQGYKVIG